MKCSRATAKDSLSRGEALNTITNGTLRARYQTLSHVRDVREGNTQERNLLLRMSDATIVKREATMDPAAAQNWMNYPLQKSVAHVVETWTQSQRVTRRNKL